jgi:uncharacterized CHY-type Zn-finger protein
MKKERTLRIVKKNGVRYIEDKVEPKKEEDSEEEYYCSTCGKKISREEYEDNEEQCSDCFTEYVQEIEDDNGYYP